MTLYLTPPSGKGSPTRDAVLAGHLGMIDTPYQQNRVHDLHEQGAAWCTNNGCFSSRWKADRWWAFLEQVSAPYAGSCLFATAPDVVSDAAATLEKSLPWMPRMRELGYKVAFVAQNGIEKIDVPWDELNALFIGRLGRVCPVRVHPAHRRTTTGPRPDGAVPSLRGAALRLEGWPGGSGSGPRGEAAWEVAAHGPRQQRQALPHRP